jgi:hypothetical protein
MPNLSKVKVALAVMACALLALPAFAGSQARIVRLSDVQGKVQIDKNTGLGFESAFLNLPVTQGAQLKTSDNGRAEVEFEDGSTLRLAPNSTVQFSALGSTDSGKHLSTIDLVEGMAYVNWLGKSGDQINLDFSREKVSLEHAAHFRITTSTETSKLAVFKGDVDVESPSGNVTVPKKETATFDGTANDKSQIAKNIEEAPLDSWDKESIAYHEQYAKNNNNSSPYGYGNSDLNYYGNFMNVPGYGMMWQPYFTGVGWDPFMDGAWSYYPGYGYMFVSAYPWGWMPYRYGNWVFAPGFGWMWQPGGFNTWGTVPHYSGTGTVHVTPLVAPTGTVKTVAVGKGGPVSTLATSSRLVVNSGSAGLGIPRGSISNLHHLNNQVAKTGFATVHTGPQFSGSSGRTPGFGGPQHSSMAPPPAVHSTAPAPHVSTGTHH